MSSSDEFDRLDWQTCAVTALPTGWVNVYKSQDGTWWTEPCPAILVQEKVVNVRCFNGDAMEYGGFERITRTVYATAEIGCPGQLVAVGRDTYEFTTTADDWKCQRDIYLTIERNNTT